MLSRITPCRVVLSRACSSAPCGRRWFSAAQLESPVQAYISTSQDPYLNLSIEHHLLRKSSPESAILFLYVNRPSIIIGRNQNPWLEVNLALLDQAVEGYEEPAPTALGAVDLVRRRSGGGTVFHDEGNVNWTVISPSAAFTRDKHAEMVVRALRSCVVDRARVNERHDVVLDQGSEAAMDVDPDDTHATSYQVPAAGEGPRPLKVSGSAYKLTRARALHHGTCLLNSPNLNVIPHYLHSPAKPFIKARGVESVSSPVGNIVLSNERFVEAVQHQFGKIYSDSVAQNLQEVGSECLHVGDIKEGYEELKSLDWTYLQTPQFTLTSPKDLALQQHGQSDAEEPGIELTVRSGVITESKLNLSGPSDSPARVVSSLESRKLHEIHDWHSTLAEVLSSGSGEHEVEWNRAAAWLQQMLPSINNLHTRANSK